MHENTLYLKTPFLFLFNYAMGWSNGLVPHREDDDLGHIYISLWA